jgi:hypothetical protein
VRTIQSTSQLLPAENAVSPQGFVQFDLSEFEVQIAGETELQDAVRLLFEVMGGLGGNYYLKQSEGSRLSADFLNSQMSRLQHRAQITLTRPTGSVITRVVTASTIPSLGEDERLVLASGFEGGLPNFVAGARLAQEVSSLYSGYLKDGRINDAGEAAQSIADSRIPQAVARFAGLRQTPDGARLADYFSGKLPAEEAMELAIKPLKIFVELGRALKTALWTQISA